jgi:hypothetical protein
MGIGSARRGDHSGLFRADDDGIKGKQEDKIMEMQTIWKRKKAGDNHATDIMFFVAAAMVEDAKKSQLSIMENRIWYDGKKKRIWATDGYRLHLAAIDFGEKDFTFHVISKKKGEIIGEIEKERPNLPNISIVLSNHKTIAYHTFQEYLSYPKKPEIPYVQFMRLYEKKVIDQEFFNDLFNIPGTWKALIGDEDSSQVFKNENCLAMIMMMDV